MDKCDFGDRPYGGGSVMIWGVSLMIASWTWSPYEETGDQYFRDVLQPVVVHHFDNHPIAARPVFMDDNARPHRSMAVKWNETVTSLPWPVMDPDLIPIEHVWDMLNHRLQAVETHYTKLTSVGSSIASVWAAAFLLMYFVKPLKCHNRSHLCFWDYLVRNFMTLIVSFVV